MFVNLIFDIIQFMVNDVSLDYSCSVIKCLFEHVLSNVCSILCVHLLAGAMLVI